MEFKDWMLLSEQPHLRVGNPVTLQLPGDFQGSREKITFDNIDLRFERYLPQIKWGPWVMGSPKFREIFGFQCKFPFSNQYLYFRKDQPTILQVGPFQQDLELTPDYWHQKAIFAYKGQEVYFHDQESAEKIA